MNGSKLQLRRVRRLRLRSSEDCLDPRDELAWIKRLGEVIVCAELQSDYSINIVASRGKHDDRNITGFTNFFEGVQSTDTR